MLEIIGSFVARWKSQAELQCKAYLATLWQWMKRPFSLDVDDRPPQPGFASPHVKEERSRQPWQKWQMVKSLVSLLPFHPLIFPHSVSPCIFFVFLALSSVSLWLSLTLDPLTTHSLTLCFCFSVHVRGCEDQWPGCGPLHCMEWQFHHRQSWED